jgi:hypothetical protein
VSVELRPVENDVDVEAWLHVRRVVLPNESAVSAELFRARSKPEHLHLLPRSTAVYPLEIQGRADFATAEAGRQ